MHNRLRKIHKKSVIVIGLGSWDFASTLRTPSPSPKTTESRNEIPAALADDYYRFFVDFTQARGIRTTLASTPATIGETGIQSF